MVFLESECYGLANRIVLSDYNFVGNSWCEYSVDGCLGHPNNTFGYLWLPGGTNDSYSPVVGYPDIPSCEYPIGTLTAGLADQNHGAYVTAEFEQTGVFGWGAMPEWVFPQGRPYFCPIGTDGNDPLPTMVSEYGLFDGCTSPRLQLTYYPQQIFTNLSYTDVYIGDLIMHLVFGDRYTSILPASCTSTGGPTLEGKFVSPVNVTVDPWQSDRNYGLGVLVSKGGKYWESIQSPGSGHDPEEVASAWWTEVTIDRSATDATSLGASDKLLGHIELSYNFFGQYCHITSRALEVFGTEHHAGVWDFTTRDCRLSLQLYSTTDFDWPVARMSFCGPFDEHYIELGLCHMPPCNCSGNSTNTPWFGYFEIFFTRQGGGSGIDTVPGNVLRLELLNDGKNPAVGTIACTQSMAGGASVTAALSVT